VKRQKIERDMLEKDKRMDICSINYSSLASHFKKYFEREIW
jgi:hypothetical protein